MKKKKQMPKYYRLPEQFYYQPILEADFESFMLWTGWIYASDKNHVYILFRYDIPMLDASSFNYEILRKDGSIQYPFYAIIQGANTKE
jgi:hypothetical protein